MDFKCGGFIFPNQISCAQHYFVMREVKMVNLIFNFNKIPKKCVIHFNHHKSTNPI